MNIYAAADLHGNLPEVPGDADAVLLAGDICPDFRPYGRRGRGMVDQSGTQQAHWLEGEFREWLDSFYCPVFATWGNHDFVGERSSQVPALRWYMLKDEAAHVLFPRHATAGYVHQDDVMPVSDMEVSRLNIYGTPWVPGLPYWAFYGRPAALQARAEAIPEGLDVLMTHGPPHGFGDFIPTSERQRNKYGNFGGENVGDPTLNEAIKRARPRAVICGHIHEARGVYDMDGIPVYNVAAVDSLYDLYPEPWTKIDL